MIDTIGNKGSGPGGPIQQLIWFDDGTDIKKILPARNVDLSGAYIFADSITESTAQVGLTVYSKASLIPDVDAQTEIKGGGIKLDTTLTTVPLALNSAGSIWYDSSVGKFKFNELGSWVTLTDFDTFLELTDTPASYNAGRILFEGAAGVTDDPDLFWDNSNKRLGLATTIPDKTLELNFYLGTYAEPLNIEGINVVNTYDSATAAAGIHFQNSAKSWAAGIFGRGVESNNNSQLHFYVEKNDSRATKMMINEDGNIGIGTLAPAVRLDLGIPATNNRLLSLASAGAGTGYFYGFGTGNRSAIGYLDFIATSALTGTYTDGVKLTISQNGNVGIGTIIPNTKLHNTGGETQGVTGVNASTYTLLVNDRDLSVVYTATGSVTITIPQAQNVTGRIIDIADDGDNAFINNIVIQDDAGVPNVLFTIDSNSTNLTLKYNGTTWRIK